MALDLTTEFCGIRFRNPLIIPAGSHGRDGETIREISRSGVAGICTKTIVAQPAPDVLPCFVRVSAGMINAVFGTDKSADYWFSKGIQEAKKGESVVIANLAGFFPEQAAELATKAEAAGADMIEVPTHCPHMGEILNAMYPGMNYPEPKLTDLEPMKQSVRAIKARVNIPVIVKLSGTFMHIVGDWARGVKEAGADGIASSDALGPALLIDIRTGQPRLGGPRGIGGLTGPAIMPIALRMVLDIAQAIDLPIVGVGGVGSASDVVEYLMAGATLVGVCTAGHLNGPQRYAKIISDLGELLVKLGVTDLSEIRGLTLRRIRERAEKGQAAVTKPVPAVVDGKLCNGCTLCERVCVYGAARMQGKARGTHKAAIDPETCVGCGLCVGVCPTEAITQVYY
ncbi:MAG: 4Fe-4S dicluster domain-containing protein [Gemmatimonadales bacterium]|nr:MAG: 4Fe-4S dicluster domain-containing protein [Gemmatimonadales bacterium]